jgi:hypothetical protein
MAPRRSTSRRLRDGYEGPTQIHLRSGQCMIKQEPLGGTLEDILQPTTLPDLLYK